MKGRFDKGWGIYLCKISQRREGLFWRGGNGEGRYSSKGNMAVKNVELILRGGG